MSHFLFQSSAEIAGKSGSIFPPYPFGSATVSRLRYTAALHVYNYIKVTGEACAANPNHENGGNVVA